MKITHRSASTAKHTPGVCFGYAHRVCVGLVVWGLIAGAVLGGTSPAWAKEKVEDGWYPFSFPEKLDPNSPANIGKLVLDAPAGKHGFVKVKEGHFYFEDGTRAKFWGTNLCFNANFPDKKQAEMLADHIAFFGFNAVRLHHMDFFFEPKGIFEDIAPMYKDPQMKQTGTLSKTQLKRLDYLIYLLKQRGMYVDMNLLVARHFTNADGVIDADKLGMAAKPVSMFDPKLIELQKQYAKDLLSHVNPHTKLRYADDPAIALVEITNENSIVEFWKNNSLNGSLYGFKMNAIPDDYIKILDQKWNEWLKNKYGTDENVKKAWAFLPRLTEQNNPVVINGPAEIAAWKIEQHEGALAKAQKTETGVLIDIRETTNTPWHLQFRRFGFDLKKDKNYLISFTAQSETQTSITLVSQQVSSPWKNLGLSETLSLTPVSQAFEIPFVPNEDCANAKIGFIIGQARGTITLNDILIRVMPASALAQVESTDDFAFRRPLYKLLRIEPEQKQKDIAQFYNDLQASYFSAISAYLRKDLGVRVPITGIGGITRLEDSLSQKSLDFLDFHDYWDHPKFPKNTWDMNDFRIENLSMLLDSNRGIIANIKKRTASIKNTPITITEWQHAYPNRYAYETPIVLAASAQENDWDGLFQFAFSHGWDFGPELNNIHSYFDTIANPQQLILCALAGRLYLSHEKPTLNFRDGYYTVSTPSLSAASGFIKDKRITLGSISFTPQENGTAVLTGLDGQSLDQTREFLLFTIGEIKNTGSGWNADGKFDWGKGSVLLKAIPIKNVTFGPNAQPIKTTEDQMTPWKIIQKS